MKSENQSLIKRQEFFLKINMSELTSTKVVKFPFSPDKILEEEPTEIEPLSTRSGDVTGIWQGVTLHSRFDPMKEALNTVKFSIPREVEGVVVFGFGLGYHIEAILSFFPTVNVWILEPNLAFFRAALELRDFTALFSNKRISLFLGADFALGDTVLQELEDIRFSIFKYRPSVELHTEFFRKVEQALQRLHSRRQVNLNTLHRFGKLWVRNFIRNLPVIEKRGGIDVWENRFHHFPALLIAAGPSLDDVLPHLKQLKERFLVISVDTSYSACLGAGVEPDFVLVMDPQYWNTRHLDRVWQQSSRLISEPSTHPAVFRRLPGRTFLAGSLFPLGRYLEGKTGKKKLLGAGGSVSTSAWDFGRILGCNPLIFAGLDLSFPRKHTHCKGSFFEERVFSFWNRFKPGETEFFRYLHDANPIQLPSNRGGSVLTDQRMLIYRDWFEIQGQLHPHIHTRTLSKDGLRIEGIEPVSLEELLSFPHCRNSLEAILHTADRESALLPRRENIAEGVQELIEGLQLLSHLSQKGLQEVEILLNRFHQGQSISFQQLEEIDHQILSNQFRDVAGFLLANTLKTLEKSGDLSTEQVLRNSQRIYTDLLSSIQYHIEALQDFKKYQDFPQKAGE
ncbi:MAG TPA: DUF115 domain-containing protein [Spirochaetales bacterium]|nr:DUF115 domain-containing protein [Spirochaetales bacterium]